MRLMRGTAEGRPANFRSAFLESASLNDSRNTGSARSVPGYWTGVAAIFTAIDIFGARAHSA